MFTTYITTDNRYMIGTCLTEQLQALQVFIAASGGYVIRLYNHLLRVYSVIESI